MLNKTRLKRELAAAFVYLFIVSTLLHAAGNIETAGQAWLTWPRLLQSTMYNVGLIVFAAFVWPRWRQA